MNIHIIYRLCDKVDAVNGLSRPFNLNKAKTIQHCFKSLVASLGDNPWAMTVLADDVTPETIQFISDNAPKRFDIFNITKSVADADGVLPDIEQPLIVEGAPHNSNYMRILEAKPALKNLGSIQRAYDVADKIKGDDTWVYFLEDDYLHDFATFWMRLNDFVSFSEQTKFALPFFIHPSDYPDQYTRLLTRCYLFQTNSGYWREVCSTTGTFMCHIKTYRKFADFIKESGTDDGKLSSIFKKSALCFSPMPGLATHMHDGVMSNYVHWEKIVKATE
jgi:hypothetical protein